MEFMFLPTFGARLQDVDLLNQVEKRQLLCYWRDTSPEACPLQPVQWLLLNLLLIQSTTWFGRVNLPNCFSDVVDKL